MYVVNGSDGRCIVAVRLIVGVRYLDVKGGSTVYSNMQNICIYQHFLLKEVITAAILWSFS